MKHATAFLATPLFWALLVLASGCGKRMDRDLIGACGTGNTNEIRRLLALGANVNCQDGSLNRWTPLIWALFEGDDDAAQVLLAAGANPNIKDGTGHSTLSFAVRPGDHSAVIRALVLAGANSVEYKPLFEGLSETDTNRIAFEEALAEASRSNQVPSGAAAPQPKKP